VSLSLLFTHFIEIHLSNNTLPLSTPIYHSSLLTLSTVMNTLLFIINTESFLPVIASIGAGVWALDHRSAHTPTLPPIYHTYPTHTPRMPLRIRINEIVIHILYLRFTLTFLTDYLEYLLCSSGCSTILLVSLVGGQVGLVLPSSPSECLAPS
jgi:hypothetical protein